MLFTKPECLSPGIVRTLSGKRLHAVKFACRAPAQLQLTQGTGHTHAENTSLTALVIAIIENLIFVSTTRTTSRRAAPGTLISELPRSRASTSNQLSVTRKRRTAERGCNRAIRIHAFGTSSVFLCALA